MELRIENYSEEDRNVVLDGLVELQKVEMPLSDTRVPATGQGAEQYLAELLENVTANRGAFLCAHADGALAGFVVCWIESDPTPNETLDSCVYDYISDAFVFEKYRSQGIFKALNRAAEKHLTTSPEIKRVRINVLANNTQAHEAYRATGYKEYEIMLEKKLQ